MGGKVFDNTVKIEDAIQLNYIIATMAEILRMRAVDLDSCILGSGSTRNYPLSDLDFNMDKDLYDQEHITNMLISRLGADSVNQLGNTIYCRLALGAKMFQVDFMFGDYEWQKFAYAGAIDSQYKGVHRNMLIKAYCAMISDQVVVEDDKIVARAGYTFMVQTGLMYRYRHRHFKRGGKTRVKAFSELILSDWNDFYREGLEPFTQPSTVITDPDKAMQKLFSVDATDPIFDSFESLRDCLKDVLTDKQYTALTYLYKTMCDDNRVPYNEGDM